jgi:ribosome biogenesis GTPase A
MHKALKQIQSKLRMVDLVLEIRDARVPLTSSNFALDDILGTKKRLIVFNKANLANPEKTILWQEYFRKNEVDFIFINALDKSSINSIVAKAKDSILQNYLKESPDGLPKEKKAMMIVGLPNTGKSTLINRMAKRDATRTADRPGQTQVQQWIKIEPGFELLDTPGVMPPKIENEEKGIWLGAVHAIPSKIVGPETIACYLTKYFIEKKNEKFRELYQLENFDLDYLEALEKIGKVRRCLIKGGEIDYERVYKMIVLDFRNGKHGNITFEVPA